MNWPHALKPAQQQRRYLCADTETVRIEKRRVYRSFIICADDSMKFCIYNDCREDATEDGSIKICSCNNCREDETEDGSVKF